MKRRYVVCGVSGRAIGMWITPMYRTFAKQAELVGMLDIDPLRFKVCKQEVPESKDVPEYMPDQFDQMIEETKPDAVFVVSRDCFHAHYIIKALEKDLDVITEKPMTTNWEDGIKVREAEKKSKGKVTCTFNYRYNPQHRLIRELVLAGKVGRVTHVDLNWYIDIHHGSSYFNRWNRMRENSGSLSIHKASHHFDLVNWWIDSQPETVFSMGALRFYGKENAENRGVTDFYFRCRGSKVAEKDPFRFTLPADPCWAKIYNGIYFDSEAEDQYYRDKSVFGDGISIEDNMGVIVRYKNKAILTYSLNAHAPWEGYRVCFNGTKGRLEFNVVEVSSSSADGKDVKVDFPGAHPLKIERAKLLPEIIFQPHWGKPHVIDYPEVAADADHGGGGALT